MVVSLLLGFLSYCWYLMANRPILSSEGHCVGTVQKSEGILPIKQSKYPRFRWCAGKVLEYTSNPDRYLLVDNPVEKAEFLLEILDI